MLLQFSYYKLNSPSGLSVYEYQKYISFSSNEYYRTRLHTPSKAGNLYTTSSSDEYRVKSLKEPKEVYKIKEDVLMQSRVKSLKEPTEVYKIKEDILKQTIKVEDGTFKINEHLFTFL